MHATKYQKKYTNLTTLHLEIDCKNKKLVLIVVRTTAARDWIIATLATITIDIQL